MSTLYFPSPSMRRRAKTSLFLLLLIITSLTSLYSSSASSRMLLLNDTTPQGVVIVNGSPRLSPDGSTVIIENSGWPGEHAHKWTEVGGWTSLGALSGGPNNISHARAASTNGSVIVGISTSSKAPYGWEAFRWKNGTMSGIALGWATDVSANGNTIVGSFESGSNRGIVWRLGSGGIIQPFALPSNISWVGATAVSRDGNIIVGETYDPSASHDGGFYWSSKDGLHLLPGRPTDLSGDGSIIVGWRFTDDGRVIESVRWEKKYNRRSGVYFSETRLEKSGPGESVSLAFRISGNGKVIVLGDKIWTQDVGMQSLEQYLNDTLKSATGGWSDLRATDVSDDGKVLVGKGVYQGSGPHMWHANDTPTPTTYLLLHGLNSSPGTWNKLVYDEFDSDCRVIDYIDIALDDIPKDKRCYRYHFAPRTVDNREWKNGDAATFDMLGKEVRKAVLAVSKATNASAIVIIGHSRGGLAARAFLQALPARLKHKVGLLTIGTPHQGSPFGRIKHWLHTNGYELEDANWFQQAALRFLWSPSTGYLATSHDALGYPIRTTISEPIWSLNDKAHYLYDVTDVLGEIYSTGLVLGENVIAGGDLFDNSKWAWMVPGDFEKMRTYVLENIMPPNTFECDDNDKQDDGNWACNGDGIVPRVSQTPGFYLSSELKRVSHTNETERTEEIAKILDRMTNMPGFQRFRIP